MVICLKISTISTQSWDLNAEFQSRALSFLYHFQNIYSSFQPRLKLEEQYCKRLMRVFFSLRSINSFSALAPHMPEICPKQAQLTEHLPKGLLPFEICHTQCILHHQDQRGCWQGEASYWLFYVAHCYCL